MSDTSTPHFLQGRFPFKGAGFDTLTVIDDSLAISVPDGSTLQAVYFRGGNSSDEMITVALMHDGEPVRYFPIPAQGATHIPLRLVADFLEGAELSLTLAAPTSASGTVIIDLGLVEF
ncbi:MULTISPECIES: molybdopterin oxidoreductase [unclassified Gordonia (in: high G+C Gram-positive bacteria)]